MKTEYRVLNPATGQYEKYMTVEEATVRSQEIALEFYKSHCHNTPVSKVIITEEGAEIWGAP